MKRVTQKLLPSRGSKFRASATGSSSTSDAPYGLKELSGGTNPVVDIVAVHGLDGHRETTWTSRTDECDVLWLQHLLPSKIPNIRVWTWGYDSRTFTKSHDDHTTNKNLYDHGRELVQDLDSERRADGSYQRPIIFVAHSLGGIIVKNALLHSDRVRQGHLEDERSIKVSTYGIVFMGTPHQGGQGAKLAEFLLNLAKVQGNTNDSLLKHLEYHSELLQSQNSEFTAISQDFDIKFFYETLPTPIAAGAAITVVPKWSAVVSGTPDAAEFGISQDHTRMTKFPNAEDPDFKKLSRVLVSMVQKATFKIEKNWYSEGRMKQDRQVYDVPFNIRGVPVVGIYVERVREMQTMAKILSPGAENKQRRIFVLHGLGGIGKTQLALAYARKYQHTYTAVFWLNGQTRESLEQSLAGLASQLPKDQISDLAKRSTQQGNEQFGKVVQEVKSWLSRDGNRNWLLLYDNVDRDDPKTSDDPEAFDVSEYLPECDQGSIIITTRQHRLRTLGDEMPLAEMTAEEGLQLLASRIGKSFIDDPQADELVARVGSLPLALAQAASYMRETNTSMTEYLGFYNTAWDDLMKYEARPGFTLREYGNRSVHTTWAISFEGVKRKNEDAAKLLQVWSYLDNRDIWFEIFNNENNSDLGYWSNPPEWFRRAVRDKMSFKGVAATLLAYSLIEARQDSESYGMHPVVHEWCRKTVTTDRQPELAFLAITSVAFGVPHPDDGGSWPTQRRLLQHANRFSHQMMDTLEETLESGREIEFYSACVQLGRLKADGGTLTRMWVEAEAMYYRAIAGYGKYMGMDHRSTTIALSQLAVLYGRQERFEESEALNRRILAVQTDKLGLDHPDTMLLMSNLAADLSFNNKLAEAEDLYRHLSTNRNFNQNLVSAALGSVYEKQGRLTEAEAMYLQAIAGYTSELKAVHPDLLKVRFNLGVLYEHENRLVEAEATMHQVLEGRKEVFGLDHEATMKAMQMLGSILKKQGKSAEADAVYEQALAGYRTILGPEHEWSFGSLRDVGLCYIEQGKLTEAEALLLQCLESSKHITNDQETSTQLDCINILGFIYAGQARFAEAEAMFQQALLGKRRVLGLEHESTLGTLQNLRRCYKHQGKFAEAAALFPEDTDIERVHDHSL